MSTEKNLMCRKCGKERPFSFLKRKATVWCECGQKMIVHDDGSIDLLTFRADHKPHVEPMPRAAKKPRKDKAVDLDHLESK